MASSNFLQFDANKTNILTDQAYNDDEQRLGGVSQGVARSTLYNKTAYQTTTMAAAIAQMLVNNGKDAMDTSLSGLVNALQQAIFTNNRMLLVDELPENPVDGTYYFIREQ